MNNTTDCRLVRRLTAFATASALFSALVGLAALAGWVFHLASLRSWVPGRPSMNPSVAAAFAGVVSAFGLLNHAAGNIVPRDRVSLTAAICFAPLVLGVVASLGWIAVRIERVERQRIAEVAECESCLRIFIEHAPAALAMFDREMRYLYASRRWLADFSLGDRDPRGLAHYELFPEISENWKQVHRRALSGEVLRAEDDRFERLDGSVQWLRWEARPWYKSGGAIGGIVIFSEDITECKRAEEALRESHARLRKMLEVETVGVLYWDLDTGRLADANDTFLNLMGYSRADLESGELSRQTLTPPEYMEVSRAELRKFAASGRLGPYEKEYFHKDGTRQWLLFAGSSLDGNSCVEFCIDITDRKKAEAALRESEQRFQALANGIPQMAWMAEADGHFFWYNDRWFEYTGTTPEAMKGWGWQYVHDPVTLPAVLDRWKSSLMDGTPFEMEFPLRGADGVFRMFLTRVLPLKDSRGQVVRWFGTNTDISVLKQAEEAVRESECRVRTLLDSTAEAILGNDLDGICTFCNPAALRLLGYERPERLIGENLHAKVHHSRVDGTPLSAGDCPLGCAVRTGSSFYSDDMMFWRRDGASFPAECWSHPLLKDGQVQGSVITFFDVTERKRAEAAVRENRARLDAALASMTDAVFISDSEGRLVDFNDAFASFHRFPSKAECARTLREYPAFLEAFVGSETEPAPLERWAVSRALRGESATGAEYTLRRKDTGESWVGSYSFAPIRSQDGAIVGSVVVGRDVTQKKAIEQEILRLNDELEERVEQRTAQLEAANRELEAFTYSVSHDLRAPLRHIGGFSKILLEDFRGDLPTGAQRHLDRIVEGTRRMGILVDDLLNLGRVGRQELRLQVTGLRAIVDEAIRDLQPECAGRAIAWKIGELPSVDGDTGLLRQLMQNLLSNALKFTRPRAAAVIEIGCREIDGVSEVFVRDNGVGFSMKYADKLFGVFQRLHRQEDFEGTGVGLATVQRIVRKHGGSIWAEAELDKGATFHFTLGNAGKNLPSPGTFFLGGAP